MIRSKKNKKTIGISSRRNKSFKSRKRRSYRVVGGSPTRRSYRTRKSPDLLADSQARDAQIRNKQLIQTRVSRKKKVAELRKLQLTNNKIEAYEKARQKEQKKRERKREVEQSRHFRLNGRPGRRPFYQNIHRNKSRPLTQIGRIYPDLIPEYYQQNNDDQHGSLDPVLRDHLVRQHEIGAIGARAPVYEDPRSIRSRKLKVLY